MTVWCVCTCLHRLQAKDHPAFGTGGSINHPSWALGTELRFLTAEHFSKSLKLTLKLANERVHTY